MRELALAAFHATQMPATWDLQGTGTAATHQSDRPAPRPPNMVLSPLRPQAHPPCSCTPAPSSALHQAMSFTCCPPMQGPGLWCFAAACPAGRASLHRTGLSGARATTQQAGSYAGSSLERPVWVPSPRAWAYTRGPNPFRRVHAKMELRMRATAPSQQTAPAPGSAVCGLVGAGRSTSPAD